MYSFSQCLYKIYNHKQTNMGMAKSRLNTRSKDTRLSTIVVINSTLAVLELEGDHVNIPKLEELANNVLTALREAHPTWSLSKKPAWTSP